MVGLEHDSDSDVDHEFLCDLIRDINGGRQDKRQNLFNCAADSNVDKFGNVSELAKQLFDYPTTEETRFDMITDIKPQAGNVSELAKQLFDYPAESSTEETRFDMIKPQEQRKRHLDVITEVESFDAIVTEEKRQRCDAGEPETVEVVPLENTRGRASAPPFVPRCRLRRRKGRSGSKQRKAMKRAREEHAGFILKGRHQVIKDGELFIPHGTARTCLPDAVAYLLDDLKIGDYNNLCRLRSVQPSLDANCKFEDMNEFISKQFNKRLVRVTNKFRKKLGTVYHLFQVRKGYFVVQLRILEPNDTNPPDLHCMAFNGESVKDNWAGRNGRTAWRMLEDEDRACPKKSLAVFQSLRPGLDISIKNIYELVCSYEVDLM